MTIQERASGSLNTVPYLDATGGAAADSFALAMNLDSPGNTFSGAYQVVAHIAGRQQNVPVHGGALVINLGSNGVSDDGGRFPEVESGSWQYFEKTLVGITDSTAAATWSLEVGAETGEVEVQRLSILVNRY